MKRPDETRPAGSAGSRFEADWLSLREPVDHRSRSEEILTPLVRAWGGREEHRIVDLGAGTGSNLRYLAPRLPGEQRWTLVDHDAALLDRVSVPGGVVEVSRVAGDLDREGIGAIGGADLVAGAALLDLVSERWLARVVGACVERRCAALFTTSFDGTVAWTHRGSTDAVRAADAREDDLRVRDLVNAHQRRDKGLGGALGPEAAGVAHRRFSDAGYRTWLVPGPWILDEADARVARLLIEGWAAAAAQQSPSEEPWIRSWAVDRQAAVASGRAHVIVGHLDLLALPPDEGAPP